MSCCSAFAVGGQLQTSLHGVQGHKLKLLAGILVAALLVSSCIWLAYPATVHVV